MYFILYSWHSCEYQLDSMVQEASRGTEGWGRETSRSWRSRKVEGGKNQHCQGL